jgi:hypothetical protein
VKSHINAAFRKLFASMPADVRNQARVAYALFRNNPRHPGLHFKHVHGSDRLVCVRIGRSYRAVGVLKAPDEVVWYWIGPHEEYERVVGAK